MAAESWQKVEAIVQSALGIRSGAERLLFIEQNCAGDTELQIKVERLITAADEAENFIESPAQTEAPYPLNGVENENSFADLSNFTGKKIDVYELKHELGRGGMGAVFLAERADGEFRQQVAVKLIKRGMDTDFIVRRFRQERQILATLEHPYIARLLGGGTSADNLPYFVMEYIEGEPLYSFCDRRQFEINERVRLFQKICQAVDAAHQLRIVHRDLKPSNILVKPGGTPKLLDFGIAKILDPDFAAATLEPTATAMHLMTPEYASPEQVYGEPVSPSSDVYSLGVLLYELLSGHRPYRFKNLALHEIHRVVCEDAPEAPSESLTGEDNLVSIAGERENAAGKSADLQASLRARNTDLKKLRRELSGDLDKIILKTLRKNPSERYQTAAELLDDLTRYLEKRPVKAESFAREVKKNEIAVFRLPDAVTSEAKKSIAILPFKIFGAGCDAKDTDGEKFLGIGLADALVTRLSVIKKIIVRPTSSVLAFNDYSADPFRAGRELTVDYVVDGNIRRAGERIRVTVQLLSAAENSTVWAQTFDEKFTDILDLEDSISARVAASLAPQLAGDEQRRLEKRGTNKPEAYRAYLRGRYYASQFSDEMFLKSIECYHEAIRLDTDYALPRVGLADFYVWSAIFGKMPSHDAFSKAKTEIDRALEIDVSLGEAYAIKAFITLIYDWNWTEAEHLIKRALELSPNFGFAHECYSNYFSTQGRFDEAVREIYRAEELDPLSPRAKMMTSWTLYIARLYPEAIAKAHEAMAMQENSAMALFHLGCAQTPNGEAHEAVKNLRRASHIWADGAMPRFMLCYALVADNKPEEAEKVLSEIEALREKSFVKPYYLAAAYAALGKQDAAFNWFEKSIEARDEWMIWFGVGAHIGELRRDARYLKILKQTNNPIYTEQALESVKAAPGEIRARSIAVLPLKLFGTPTGADENEYLSLGLTDALIMRLSNVQRLTVRPTSSVLKYQNKPDNPFHAGRELQVEYVVDGSIRRAGERIRVSVQLLKIGEETTLWAKSFDEKFTDVLEIEDSISEQIAKALIPRLTNFEQAKLGRRETNSPQAYQAYLHGRFYWNQFTPDTLFKARKAFEQAVEHDSNYALAYVGLADSYIWTNIYGLIPSMQAFELARTAIERAISLDENSGEALTTRGLLEQNCTDWEASKRSFRRALELAPNYPQAHEFYGALLVGTGNFEAGAEEIKLAASLDPFSLRAKTLLSWTLYQARYYDEALATARQILELDPNYPQGHLQTGISLLAKGEAEEALTYFERFDQMIPHSAMAKFNLCHVLVAVRRTEQARSVLNEIKTLAANVYVKPYFLGMAHAALNEIDDAFKLFEQARGEFEPWMLWFGTEPMLENLHSDRRFIEILERMNSKITSRFNIKSHESI